MAIGANIAKNVGGTAARIGLNVAGFLGAGYLINVTIPKILYKNTDGVPPEGTKPIWSPITAIGFTILASAVKNVWLKELLIGAAVGGALDTVAEYGLKDPAKRARFGLAGAPSDALFGRYAETGRVEYDPSKYMAGVGAADWQTQPFGLLNGGIGAYGGGKPSNEDVWQGIGRNLGAL